MRRSARTHAHQDFGVRKVTVKREGVNHETNCLQARKCHAHASQHITSTIVSAILTLTFTIFLSLMLIIVW
jgi:hypothetical protein